VLDKVLKIGQSIEAAKTQVHHIEQNNIKQTGETVPCSNTTTTKGKGERKRGFHNQNP